MSKGTCSGQVFLDPFIRADSSSPQLLRTLAADNSQLNPSFTGNHPQL